MASVPAGYAELAAAVMTGELGDRAGVYRLCEDLWTGLNDWFGSLGIEYRLRELPF